MTIHQIFDPDNPDSVLWEVSITDDRDLHVELLGTGSVTLNRDLHLEGGDHPNTSRSYEVEGGMLEIVLADEGVVFDAFVDGDPVATSAQLASDIFDDMFEATGYVDDTELEGFYAPSEEVQP